MGMSKKHVNSKNYFVVHGWMINELELKGNELCVYAIIYGFSQAEGTYFNGSQKYLAEWVNISPRAVRDVLKRLVERGLLIKQDKIINSIKFCEYRITSLEELEEIKGKKEASPTTEESSGNIPYPRKILPLGTEESSGGAEETSPGCGRIFPEVRKNLPGGAEESAYNNIDIYIDNNKSNNIKDNIGGNIVCSISPDEVHTDVEVVTNPEILGGTLISPSEYISLVDEFGADLTYYEILRSKEYKNCSNYQTVQKWCLEYRLKEQLKIKQAPPGNTLNAKEWAESIEGWEKYLDVECMGGPERSA